MTSRPSARPKRDGENFARTHHHDHDETDSKQVKFDLRNPSTLAPDAREDDAILDADVIGGSGTKRGAVNLDGYDSDSDNDNFDVRAEKRKKEKDDAANFKAEAPDATASDDDMFAADDDDVADENKVPEEDDIDESGSKKKEVRFLDADQIDGVENTSRNKEGIRLDDAGSSDDEADVELAIQEEGVDEEVGLGGLKKNAPKVEAFNLKQEMEEGQFDQDGNYVRKSGDPDAVHDNWLEGLSKKEMKKAAAAHEKREAEARKQRLEDDEILVSELLKTLILNLERAETPLEALARLGKKQTKPKKIPKWKLKKMNKGAEGMDIDGGDDTEDPEQKKIKASINAITEAADKLLSRDYEEIYEQERELLVREYRKETGEDWVEPAKQDDEEQRATVKPGTMWEFRWADGRDGDSKQGPYDGATMKAWKDAGYFPDGAVEFRAVEEGHWTAHVDAFE
ncbi:lin1 family [Fusarium longipes]|uniref:Lin1 family n=1 Tax=Fusarium longipes TaxID=694270 RepID=A0A395S358_9HYPO|nr:lin1 family [Fusarium longipes]